MTLTIGKYLLNRLQEHGVDHIFGIPGDYVLQFDKRIEEHPIHFVNTTRENTAGLMADAYARIKGLGAACITYGVGINITNAVSQAYAESSPLIVISGAAGTAEFSRSNRLHHLFNKPLKGPRDTTQMEIFSKITVAQALLDNPDTAAGEIDRIIGECLCRKKPVYLELPRDQVDATIGVVPQRNSIHEATNKEALGEVLLEIETILKNCRRPVIWVGHEIHRYGLAGAVQQFVEKYHIPFATTLLGKSALSEHHPLFIGTYQGKISREEISHYIDGCDCILALGVVLNDVDTGMFTVDFTGKQTVMAASETVSVNHHQYSEIFFTDLIRKLSETSLNVRFKDEYPANIDRGNPIFDVRSEKVTSRRLFECLQSHLSSKHVLVSDFGDCLFGGSELTVDQNCFLSNAYFANLGFGVPGAIAAQLALPEKRVIGLVGDGAFQMTCMELSTAARFNVDPIIIVLNNHGYATERPLLEGSFNDIGNWNYSALPQLVRKGIGIQVKTEVELDSALTKALSTRGEFVLIEVELEKNDYSPALQRFVNVIRS